MFSLNFFRKGALRYFSRHNGGANDGLMRSQPSVSHSNPLCSPKNKKTRQEMSRRQSFSRIFITKIHKFYFNFIKAGEIFTTKKSRCNSGVTHITRSIKVVVDVELRQIKRTFIVKVTILHPTLSVMNNLNKLSFINISQCQPISYSIFFIIRLARRFFNPMSILNKI